MFPFCSVVERASAGRDARERSSGQSLVVTAITEGHRRSSTDLLCSVVDPAVEPGADRPRVLRSGISRTKAICLSRLYAPPRRFSAPRLVSEARRKTSRRKTMLQFRLRKSRARVIVFGAGHDRTRSARHARELNARRACCSCHGRHTSSPRATWSTGAQVARPREARGTWHVYDKPCVRTPRPSRRGRNVVALANDAASRTSSSASAVARRMDTRRRGATSC